MQTKAVKLGKKLVWDFRAIPDKKTSGEGRTRHLETLSKAMHGSSAKAKLLWKMTKNYSLGASEEVVALKFRTGER